MIHFNKTYLNHDYSTDIITFDNSENKKISGDIVISIERVKENSKKYKVKLEDELRRVMAHGLLHLLGYDDKNEKEKKRRLLFPKIYVHAFLIYVRLHSIRLMNE